MGPPFYIDGPAPVPPPYRLIDVATIIDEPDEHWLNGVGVHSYPDDVPVSFDPCSAGSDRIKADGGIIPLPEFGAYTIYLSETCTPRSISSQEEFKARAEIALGASESYAVEIEFASGAALPLNPYLNDSNLDVISASAESPVRALGRLEDAIAVTARGGIIHVSPAASIALSSAYLVQHRSNQLFTMRGTPIVVGTGYVGQFPDSVGTLGVDEAWIYATGPIQIRRTAIETIPANVSEALDREVNSITYRAERHYLVDWDTALQAGTLLDLSGCC